MRARHVWRRIALGGASDKNSSTPAQTQSASEAAEKTFSCHAEACFSPKNLSVRLTQTEERFFASLRMTKR
jgi:hypothetical protein